MECGQCVILHRQMDKPGADPYSVKVALMEHGVLLEEFGGETQCALISAKRGDGIDDLLERILLQAEVMDLRSGPLNDQQPADGVALEARADRRLGAVVSAIVQRGVLRVGDYLLCGPTHGRVKRILDDRGKELSEATPSVPVQVEAAQFCLFMAMTLCIHTQIVGLNAVPLAGDRFTVVSDAEDARLVADARMRLTKQRSDKGAVASIFAQVQDLASGAAEATKEEIRVPVVLKADAAGSLEALRSSIAALTQSDDSVTCRIDLVYAGVGDVIPSDVSVAAACKSRVVAFNTAAGSAAISAARSSNVKIEYYSVVYELLDELAVAIKAAMTPMPPGDLLGRAEVRKIFSLGKSGKIAGCAVTEGALQLHNSRVRVLRGPRDVVFSGTLASIKSGKTAVRTVEAGAECGVTLSDGFNDLAEGDVIECFAAAAAGKEGVQAANVNAGISGSAALGATASASDGGGGKVGGGKKRKRK